MPNPFTRSMLVPRAEEAGNVVNGSCDCRCSSCRSSAGHRHRGRRRSHRTRTYPNAPLTRANRTRWALRSHIYPRIRAPDARCSCSVALPPPPSAPTAPIYALLAAASAFLFHLTPYPQPHLISHIPHPTSPPNPSHTTHTTLPSLNSTTTNLCRLLTPSHHTYPLAPSRGTWFPDVGAVHGAACLGTLGHQYLNQSNL